MKEINCLGMRCPLPIIESAKAIKDIEIGESLSLLSDDPATEPDLRAWGRMTGNVIEKVNQTQFLITKSKVN